MPPPAPSCHAHLFRCSRFLPYRCLHQPGRQSHPRSHCPRPNLPGRPHSWPSAPKASTARLLSSSPIIRQTLRPRACASAACRKRFSRRQGTEEWSHRSGRRHGPAPPPVQRRHEIPVIRAGGDCVRFPPGCAWRFRRRVPAPAPLHPAPAGVAVSVQRL